MVPALQQKVADFKLVMPCISSLRNPALQSRHWEQIDVIVKRSISARKDFTLGNLLEMKVNCDIYNAAIWRSKTEKILGSEVRRLTATFAPEEPE